MEKAMENAIDLQDRKILYELDRNSRMTFKELGKRVRISKETAAFRVKRLVKEGYIKNFLTTIHTSALNRFYYKLFYKFHRTTPQIDADIVKFISGYKSTAYFASLEGRYDLTFLLLSKNFHDLYSFLVPFREKFGEYILEQEILTLTSTHRFNFRFFFEGEAELMDTKYPEEIKEPDIDEVDYQIIANLAKNSRIPLIELAKITGTETNVVKYRIRKLLKAGILGANVLDVDFERFGAQLVQVDFTLKDHSVTGKLIGFVAQNPKSTFATITLGKYDLAVEFAVRDMKELRKILGQVKERFSHDITNEDIFTMQEHSINWFPYRMEKV
ncbi:MAG: winged helix-turn-helix transcriptional regulator [Candidatus Diapherotrites archaeon]|uniref:Winged helix-turn-helix transcriptional regulator n=1 Tax=Candidatus Iainarchaeum sp. TaxID=3101447 RepID=A0A8T3YM61_9ARCH|nr:winged helix-turn-helix transcriptional regulator [Candidatus Diapherotrites archaeon]